MPEATNTEVRVAHPRVNGNETSGWTLRIGELPPFVRAGLYVVLLGAIATTELVFDDLYAPFAVLLLFLFVVAPVAGRAFGRGRQGIDERPSPLVSVAFVFLSASLVAIEIVLLPDLGLGPTFWTIAVLIPVFELYGYSARREARSQ